MTNREDQVKALANHTRIEVLRILDQPLKYFSQQESADPVDTGVCVHLIAEHFGVSQPTMSRHIEPVETGGFHSGEASAEVDLLFATRGCAHRIRQLAKNILEHKG